MDVKLPSTNLEKNDLKKGGLQKFSLEESGKKTIFFFSSLFSGRFLFILSLILLIGVILGCLGLWGYQISLKNNLKQISQEIDTLQAQRDFELEKKLSKINKSASALKTILNKRVFPLRFFKMIEELTLPQVRFTNLRMDFSKGELSLGVEAVSYTVLAKQMKVFQEDERIKKIEVSGVDLNRDGRVVSQFNLSLESSFFRGWQE